MTDKMPKKNLFSSQINLSKFKPADEDEKRQKEIMSESTTFFKDGMKKLMRNPRASRPDRHHYRSADDRALRL